MIAVAHHFGRILNALLAWGGGAPWRRMVLTGLVAAAVIVPGLQSLPVTDRDEARFAQATRQMLESGDFIDIRFQDQPRWKKPIGIYWLQAASVTLLGEKHTDRIWAYRVPSAVAAFLAAILTAWAAGPLIGGRGAALAGLMTATTILLAAEANIAKTDATLLFCSVVVLGGFARMLAGIAGWGTALAFWIAMAAGILVKGPVLPVIAALALGWLAIAQRFRVPFKLLKPLWGIPLALVLVAPWLVAIWQVSDGAFFTESIGRDLVGKMMAGQEKHWGPPGLYLALVWGTFWPWAAFLPLAVPWLWRFRSETWLQLLAGWVIPFWIVLEAVPTKLPHYVLPLYPALAIAVAAWAVAPQGKVPAVGWRRLSAALVAIPGVALALAVILLPLIVEGKVAWPAVPLAVLGGFAALIAARSALEFRLLGQTAASIVAALALYPAILEFGLPAMKTAFPSERMAEINARWRPCASGPLISVGYREPSLVFLTETGTQLANVTYAARALEFDPGAYMLIESRWRARFEEAYPDTAPRLVERARLSYFNYNRGKSETATLLTRDDPRWDACAG